jgi:phosphoglucomutase
VELNPAAGKLPDPAVLVDLGGLLGAYYDERPDPSEPEQRVAFGTSGHRGTSLSCTFNEAHVLAISEAVCRHRASQGIDGPLFLGRDTHALNRRFERRSRFWRRMASMSGSTRRTGTRRRL